MTDVWSRCRVASTAPALLAGQSGRDQELFCSTKCPEWLMGPPSFLFSGFRGSFLRLSRPGPYADHSSPSSAVYKDKWSLLSLFTFLEFTGTGLLPDLRSRRARLKRDGTRAETRFGLSGKRTIPFKSAGESLQSTTGSRGMRISGSNGSNARYSLF